MSINDWCSIAMFLILSGISIYSVTFPKYFSDGKLSAIVAIGLFYSIHAFVLKNHLILRLIMLALLCSICILIVFLRKKSHKKLLKKFNNTAAVQMIIKRFEANTDCIGLCVCFDGIAFCSQFYESDTNEIASYSSANTYDGADREAFKYGERWFNEHQYKFSVDQIPNTIDKIYYKDIGYVDLDFKLIEIMTEVLAKKLQLTMCFQCLNISLKNSSFTSGPIRAVTVNNNTTFSYSTSDYKDGYDCIRVIGKVFPKQESKIEPTFKRWK